MDHSTFTPVLTTSSHRSPRKARSQDDEEQQHYLKEKESAAECGTVCESKSKTDANFNFYSSVLCEDDKDEDAAESTADSDMFFHTKNTSNHDLLEAMACSSCTTGSDEMLLMPDIHIDNDDHQDTAAAKAKAKAKAKAMFSCRAVKKDQLQNYNYAVKYAAEEDGIMKRKKRKREEEDKAFWEACLAYGY